MSLQLSHLRVRVVAGDRRFGADLSFDGGLNLVRAGNTSGKSTCMNSIVWALGLEGMLSPRHAIPLPHAMTSQIDGPDGAEYNVAEAYVMLEVRRSDGEYLTIRRQVAGDSRDKNLVTAWAGPALSESGTSIAPIDYYVRRRGAAREERGFHRFLADWCGWHLPEVASFDGTTVPLYLEVIAPLWIVEQKRGWAGLQALTPSYLRISDAKKRALEYVLDLDALDRRVRIQELKQEEERLRREWRDSIAAFDAEAKRAGGTARNVPQQPTGDWPPTPEPSLLVSRDNQWVAIRDAARGVAEEVDSINARSRTRDTENAELTEELDTAENHLAFAMAASSQVRHSIAQDQQSAEQAERRLATIEQDIRRHKDLLVLRRLGSEDESLLRTELCPVCNRDLGDVLLGEISRDNVMGVEETIAYLDTQKDLTRTVIESTTASLQARAAQLSALTVQSADLRSQIFALRTALVGGGAAVADAEALLAARHQSERYNSTEEAFNHMLADLSTLSGKWRTTREELQELRSGELSENDRSKLDELQSEFLDQLSLYEFKSLHTEEMSISRDTYQPAHEGYDPAFESSASDVIRIIWAYLLAVQRVSAVRGLNHPGLVIFDEPRQQMADEISFRQLLRRAAAVGSQVVFATSESQANLNDMLGDLAHNLIDFDDKVLQPLDR